MVSRSFCFKLIQYGTVQCRKFRNFWKVLLITFLSYAWVISRIVDLGQARLQMIFFRIKSDFFLCFSILNINLSLPEKTHFMYSTRSQRPTCSSFLFYSCIPVPFHLSFESFQNATQCRHPRPCFVTQLFFVLQSPPPPSSQRCWLVHSRPTSPICFQGRLCGLDITGAQPSISVHFALPHRARAYLATRPDLPHYLVLSDHFRTQRFNAILRFSPVFF